MENYSVKINGAQRDHVLKWWAKRKQCSLFWNQCNKVFILSNARSLSLKMLKSNLINLKSFLKPLKIISMVMSLNRSESYSLIGTVSNSLFTKMIKFNWQLFMTLLLILNKSKSFTLCITMSKTKNKSKIFKSNSKNHFKLV